MSSLGVEDEKKAIWGFGFQIVEPIDIIRFPKNLFK
jgi:hypothetical protein